MRVGIIQSNYIPWRGYFNFIDDVDLFIFYDDIQYTRRDWRNRNRIKTPHGPDWLTVPVKYKIVSQLICETKIDSSQPWKKSHLGKFTVNYSKAPFFKDAYRILEEGFADFSLTISDLNIRLVKIVCRYLGITTPFAMSSTLKVSGSKTERLIRILEKVGATVYLSGPAAKGYLDESLFRQNRIGLEYKAYDYPPYPQLWGEFIGTVTVLDLIANTGPDARSFLKSQTLNKIVIA